MNLFKDYTEECEKTLREFFLDDAVIEMIYKEQYGEENYKAHSMEYREQYREILNNTVFIPYITIEHLEKFLEGKRKLGDEYVQNNYEEECKLFNRLNARRCEIISEYSLIFFEKVKELLPEYDKSKLKIPHNMEELNSILKEIMEYLKNNKSLIFHLKARQLENELLKFQTDLETKILIDTSTFFEHRKKIPNDKYYTCISADMLRSESFVTQSIGLDKSRNYRYIYLPVITYHSRKKLLEVALHEVMHISKEKISGKKYRTGVFEREMSKNKNSGTLYGHSNLINIISNIKWKLFKKRMNVPEEGTMNNEKKAENRVIKSNGQQDNENSNTRFSKILENVKYVLFKKRMSIQWKSTPVDDSIVQFEEATHQSQVLKVYRKMLLKGMEKRLYMPYEEPHIRDYGHSVEKLDELTQEFMEYFQDDIRSVNSGEQDLDDFIEKIGRDNFNNLGNIYRIGERMRIKSEDDREILRQQIEIGKKVIHQMLEKSGRIADFENVRSLTNGIKGKDVARVGDTLKKRLTRNKKMTEQER